jgi:hypothetical protein
MCTDTNHNALGAILLAVLCASCSNLLNLKGAITDAKPAIDTVARSAGQNLSQGLSENAKLISQQLIAGLKGATDTLNPDIQRIEKVIDSLGDLTAAQLVKLGDSLTLQVAKIEGQVESKALQKYLVSTLESLTGRLNKDTRNLLSNMIQTTLDSLKTKSSGDKINAILANLLNDSTQRRVGIFVNGALQPTIDSLSAKIDGIVHKDAPFVQRQASLLLWSLGILAAGIIGFVWYQRSRYARLLEILTYNIDQVSPKETYDQLTKGIQAQTKHENLEPLLRSTLLKQGINT